MFRNSVVESFTYHDLLQGILGLVVFVVLYYGLGSFFAFGLLLPMGYGQAYN